MERAIVVTMTLRLVLGQPVVIHSLDDLGLSEDMDKTLVIATSMRRVLGQSRNIHSWDDF